MAVNCHLLQPAEPVIKIALKVLSKDVKDINNRVGRFVRRNQNIADYSVSKSVDTFVKKNNQKPFLC